MGRWSVLFGIIAATATALALVIHGELRAERARSADLQAQLETMRQSPPAAAPAPVAGPAAEFAAAPPPPKERVAAGDVRGNADQPDRRRQYRDLERARLGDPEYRAAWIAQQRQMIERRYPELAADLKLSPEQAERLLNLLATQMLEYQEFSLDLGRQLESAQGALDATGQRERERLMAARQQEFESARESLLGADKYQEWRDYQNSREARAQMRELRGRLSAGSSPLQEAQVGQLVTMIAGEQQRYQESLQQVQESLHDAGGPGSADREVYLERRIELLEQSQQRTLVSVAAYMDGVQLDQYRRMLNAELQREKAQLRVWRARRNAQARTGPG